MRPANLLGALIEVQRLYADLIEAERNFERAKTTARDLGATETEIGEAVALVERARDR